MRKLLDGTPYKITDVLVLTVLAILTAFLVYQVGVTLNSWKSIGVLILLSIACLLATAAIFISQLDKERQLFAEAKGNKE